MIWIVALPMFALMVGILMVMVLRGFREAGETRSSSSPADFASDRRRPSDEFHDRTWLPLCERVADVASSRLGRPLTDCERRTLWRSRSPLILQVLVKEIGAAPDAAAVSSLLASLPPGMDRPDPTGWCQMQAPAREASV